MKQYSKSRQLRVLRAAKKYLQHRSVSKEYTAICLAINKSEQNIGLFPSICSTKGDWHNVRLLYGLERYKPKNVEETGIWGTCDEKGTTKRIAVLNKRIKALSKQ